MQARQMGKLGSMISLQRMQVFKAIGFISAFIVSLLWGFNPADAAAPCIKHSVTAPGSNNPAVPISVDAWNACHTFTLMHNAIGNMAGANTINWDNGIVQSATLTGDVDVTLSNPVLGMAYRLIVTQDGTGQWTITWPASVRFPANSASQPNAAADSFTEIYLTWDGTNYNAFIPAAGSGVADINQAFAGSADGKIKGASESKPLGVCNLAGDVCIELGITSGNVAFVRNDPPADVVWLIPTDKKLIIYDEEGAAAIETIDPDAASENDKFDWGPGYRPFVYTWEIRTGAALADTDDRPDIFFNLSGQSLVVTNIHAKVTGGTGTSTVNVQRNDGTPADICTADIVATTAGVKCTSASSIVSGEATLAPDEFWGIDVVQSATSGAPTALKITVSGYWK